MEVIAYFLLLHPQVVDMAHPTLVLRDIQLQVLAGRVVELDITAL
jgi:hypothetical protein